MTFVAMLPSVYPDESLSPSPNLKNVNALNVDLVDPSASVPACPLNLTLATALLISLDVAIISSLL